MCAGETERGTVTMAVEFQAESLLLIPVGLGISFMLWVLWNWHKEEKRRS